MKEEAQNINLRYINRLSNHVNPLAISLIDETEETHIGQP